MTELPSGTLTFFFSDIEGSTRLLKAQRDRYPELLAAHRRIVRSAIEAHGGHEIDTQGDAFFVAFAGATDAVQCALDVCRSLAAHPWPQGAEVRVRIGIHTGQASSSEMGYAGLSVHRAARICAVAKGGQVLVSQATQTIIEDEEDELGFSLVDVGVRELKDLDRPVRLFEVLDAASRPVGLRTAVAGPPANAGGPEDPLRRILVLPFANISPDPADEYLADGLTEELIEKLAHVDGLGVIARTSAMHYKGTTETIRKIGADMRVGLVLECSIRKAADRVRVTAQLIEADSEEHLWASRYDRQLDDLFTIQDDISEQIAEAIRAHLGALGHHEVVGHAAHSNDTEDLAAYTDFLQGRELFRKKGSEVTIRRALGLFERAVERDPRFARARVGIAECLSWLEGEGAASRDTRGRVDAELAAALAINEGVAEAHSVLAGILVGDDDLLGASREARRAIELNPSLSDPYRWLAQVEASDGKIGIAIEVLEEAYRIDPLDVNVIAFLGRLYFYGGRIAQARELWDRTESLVEFRTHQYRAELALSSNDLDAASDEIDEMERLRPTSPWGVTFRGILLARRGDADGARACIERLNENDPGSSVTGFLIGFVRFALGELDEFYRLMDEALAQHTLPLLELLYSPLYADARHTERYEDLIRRQRAQQSR